MRSPQYPLTPSHVHTHVNVRLKKYLRLAGHGPRCTADTLRGVLCYVVKRILSLTVACAALRDAPSGTAAHDALPLFPPDFAEF